MPSYYITLKFNENGKGDHIKAVIDLTTGKVEITNMAEPFMSIPLTAQMIHDISKKLTTNGH